MQVRWEGRREVLWEGRRERKEDGKMETFSLHSPGEVIRSWRGQEETSDEGRVRRVASWTRRRKGGGIKPPLCLQRPCFLRTPSLCKGGPLVDLFFSLFGTVSVHSSRDSASKSQKRNRTNEREKTMSYSPSYLPSHHLPPLLLPLVHLLLPPSPILDPFKLEPQHPHKELRRGGQALHRVRARDAAAGEGEAGLEVAGLFGGGARAECRG